MEHLTPPGESVTTRFIDRLLTRTAQTSYRDATVREPVPQVNRRRFGFTFIELMIVMAIIAILMAVALPIYSRSIIRSKESVLKNNLFTLRTVIDEYTYDKQKAPQTLQDLVSDGYLRQIPIDPITGNADSWRLIMEDASNTVNQTQPGIFDVRSGAEGTSLEGTPYSEW
jgi:general secretion pathway protein G